MTHPRRHPADPARALAALAGTGAALLLASWLLLGDDRTIVPGWERDVFTAVNGLPDGLEWLAWPIMQLGTLWMCALGGLVAYALTRSWPAGSAAASAVALGWLTARMVKDLADRDRPVALLDDVTVREPQGEERGYVSGHTTVAFALATALTPLLPRRWRWLPCALAICVAAARVFVGVHLPLDVVGGAGLGMLCGIVALVSFGVVPARRARR